MLRSMVLDNFQSFNHIELDLSGKRKSIKDHAFIYGENGSGKSNLINALFLLQVSSGLIRKWQERSTSFAQADPVESVSELARQLRMIDSEGNMKLDFTFSFKGSDAEYVIEFDPSGKLVCEHLEFKVNTRQGTLFRLEEGHDPYFARGLIKDKRFRNQIRSELSQYWGNRSFIRILNDSVSISNVGFLTENLNPNLLSFIDGLKSMVVLTRMYDIRAKGVLELPEGTILESDSAVLDTTEKILSKFFSRLYSDVTGVYFKRNAQNGNVSYELFFRKRISGKVRDIPAKMESTGTKTMMNIISPLVASVSGGCVFVDEMDTGVHDLLITGVMEQVIPNITGQLVSTAHNTCLMESLSADNVYIIGVDPNGFKEIRCVSSIERIRPNNNIRHKYYENNFMGIPFIADLDLPSLAEIGKREE